MARTAQLRYFKPAIISGSVYKLTTVAGTAANNATVARYSAGGLSSSRRYTPVGVATADVSPPTVGTAQSNFGWRDDVAENAADQVRYAAGVWTATVRYRRSGQTLEQDQSAKITVIFYRVTSSGTFVEELGRVTSAEVLHTVTVASVALSTASIGPFTFNAGDKVQIEAYVQAFAAGLAAAPAVATDLWLTIDESSTSSRINAVPAYDILYARGLADASAASDTVARAAVLARAVANTAPASDALARAVSFPRAIANTAPASDALGRVVLFRRAPADNAPAADVLARSGSFARSVANAAPSSDTLIRAITYGRFLDEEIGTTAVDNIRTPGRKIEGVARDSAGTPVAGAVIKLVRQADDRVVRTMTTVAGGAYFFSRDILDSANTYYVIAYLAGSPETHGVTDRGQLPALV